ncbi:hypothetical protein E2C01_090360 [Portunus trituberculatus]|uniref:Uncharacterized protein n=1 Tax=Portunus trituberculatus TaxID=210409 RepID=A0A5B7JL61_PORTR|nr:hypothetical protein [Portunus trituberculatus]
MLCSHSEPKSNGTFQNTGNIDTDSVDTASQTTECREFTRSLTILCRTLAVTLHHVTFQAGTRTCSFQGIESRVNAALSELLYHRVILETDWIEFACNLLGRRQNRNSVWTYSPPAFPQATESILAAAMARLALPSYAAYATLAMGVKNTHNVILHVPCGIFIKSDVVRGEMDTAGSSGISISAGLGPGRIPERI